MHYTEYQPLGFKGRLDEKLPRIVKDLEETIRDAQGQSLFLLPKLGKENIGLLAGILADFAADIHCNTGIWKAYEKHNTELFGAPIPLTARAPAEGISEDRIRHLLWIVYPGLVPGLFLSPFHQDLLRIASASCALLNRAIPGLPGDSGVKAFLETPNGFGWEVKRKLVWLGTNSYLFRPFFKRYLVEKIRKDNKEHVISAIDDFICQECSRWSGLTGVDILAVVLDIGGERRAELLSWYERHTGAYLIQSAHGDIIEAVNVANGGEYLIRTDMNGHPFRPGKVAFGSLVPWKGEWYWSGEQDLFDGMSKEHIAQIVESMKRSHTPLLCIYWKEYERQVREKAAMTHRRAMDFYGNDLMVYFDGLTAAADWEKEMTQAWASLSPQQARETMERTGLKEPRADMSIPQHFLEHENGVGVFINPEEGREIMLDFNSIVSGLEKKGRGVTEGETEAIRIFLTGNNISPEFVRRVAREHGDESIKTAFFLERSTDDFWLDYLLRSLKGRYFRKRYPQVAVI